MDVTYGVGELAAAIGRAVGRAFPDEIWVRGQIRNLSRASSGHVYFSLVDTAAVEDRAAAQLPVTLFESDKDAVNRALIRAGAGRMDDGVEVRIRGHVQHFPSRGTVQLRMTWIDSDFTLGKLAAARAALIRRLRESGHLERNARLQMPVLPLRVGVATSLGSAAHADFLKTLRDSRWAFTVVEVDTRVQGADAPHSIVASLAALEGSVDVIALVRGGGSALDLAAFDAESVAIAIATSSHPVITGIGHEVDEPVAGEVAHFAAKTPTAAAQFLVDRVGEAARRVDDRSRRVAHGAQRSLERAGERLGHLAGSAARSSRLVLRAADVHIDRLSARVGSASRLTMARADAAIVRSQTRLVAASDRSLEQGSRRIDSVAARVAAVDPARLLARGWSVTRTADGAVVRTAQGLEPGERISTTVAGGQIASRVEATEPKEAT